MKKYFVLGIILLISASPIFKGLFFPFEKFMFFSIISVLSIAYFILKLINNENLSLKHWSIYLNLTLLAAYVLSLPAAFYYRGAIESIFQYAMYFIVFLVVFDYFKDNIKDMLKYVALPFVSGGFISAVLAIGGYAGAFPRLEGVICDGRIGSTMQYTNTAAIYFLLCTLLTVSLLVLIDKIFYRIVLAGIANMTFFSLFFTGSRGVFVIVPTFVLVLLVLVMPKGYKLKCFGYTLSITLPILFCIRDFGDSAQALDYVSAFKWVFLSVGISMTSALIFSYLTHLKLKRGLKYLAAGAFLLVLSVTLLMVINFTNIIPQSIMSRLTTINFGAKSVIYRFQFDLDALKIIKHHWLLGVGGGGWPSIYQSVQGFYYAANLVHNHFLQVFVEAGILGFVSFLSLTIISCKYYLKTLFRLKTNAEKILTTGFLCSFLALALHSAIDFNLSYSSMALIYWCLMAVSAAYIYYIRKANRGGADE